MTKDTLSQFYILIFKITVGTPIVKEIKAFRTYRDSTICAGGGAVSLHGVPADTTGLFHDIHPFSIFTAY